MADSATVSVSLKYPHNGAALRGIVFKAKEMECKWDIYIYDDIFYFTRSWTGNLLFKAAAKINADSIEITTIEYPAAEDQDLSISNVHFLIMSHALGRVFPHMVPPISSNEDIALYSFSTFGNRACYATFDTIIDTVVAKKINAIALDWLNTGVRSTRDDCFYRIEFAIRSRATSATPSFVLAVLVE